MDKTSKHTQATGGKGHGVKPKVGSPETTTRNGTGGNDKRPGLLGR